MTRSPAHRQRMPESSLRQPRRWLGGRRTPIGKRPPYRPSVDPLEDRAVPSLVPVSGQILLYNPGTFNPGTAVAAAADGHFVVAGLDRQGDITVQAYSASGTPQSGSIMVAVRPAGATLSQAAVAINDQGEFLVGWAQQGGGGNTLYAQRFGATGQAVGSAIPITSGSVSSPVVGLDAQGEFVVAWDLNFIMEYSSSFPGYTYRVPLGDVVGQRYDASGQRLGSTFVVDSARIPSLDVWHSLAVAMDGRGDFVVADGKVNDGITAVRFDAATGTLSAPLTLGSGAVPSVAVDSQGDFVVAWQGGPAGAGGVSAQRFSAYGTALGDAFIVTNNGASPAVAMDRAGDFVVAYQAGGIFAQRYDGLGNFTDGPLQVNVSTAGVQNSPSAAMDALGDAVFVWMDYPGGGPGVQDGYASLYTRTDLSGPGFAYRPATRMLDVTAGGGNNYFTFSQATTVDATGTPHTAYVFALNGASVSYADSALASVTVTASGGGNTAVLTTGDTYTGADGQSHETPETVVLGQGGGQVLKAGQTSAAPLLQLNVHGFTTEYAYLGPADSAQLLATPAVANSLVTSPAYSYLNSGGAFYFVSGGAFLYGYAANPGDAAYHYDGSGPSLFVASDNAYSYMLGTDNGRSFYNQANGFAFNYGLATHPGQDMAIFYDSPLTDVFVGYGAYSYLYGDHPDGSLAGYDQAQGFALVYAYSFVGGTDYAYVYDPTINHTTGFYRLA